MEMKDISDDELRQFEQRSKLPEQRENNQISDEALIAMVQNVKNGKLPNIPMQNVSKIVEPEMPRNSQPLPYDTSVLSKSNYWKITGLPSKNKFYSAGTEIQGRALKVLEIKKISAIGGENGDFILNDIIRRTITGIDVNELYVADKLFIIFWLRANTYRDSGYVVPFVCPKCEKKSEYHFEVDNLEVQEISDEFDPNKEIRIMSGEVITYDYLKIKDELYIDRFKEINRQAIGEIDEELLAMAQMIKKIDGKEMSLMQKYHWIIDLNPGDYSYLRTYMEKNGMGIKPFVSVTCKECGGTAAIAVSFRQDFFVPEYKFE